MKNQDYTKEMLLKSSPEKVYDVVANRINEWWTEDFTGKSNTEGDKFTVRFGNHFKTMRIKEIIPNIRIVWECLDVLIDFPELRNKTEWIGTEIVWEFESRYDQTKLRVTHIGLTPEFECYNICEEGWESFLESIKKLIETNEGTPFKIKG